MCLLFIFLLIPPGTEFTVQAHKSSTGPFRLPGFLPVQGLWGGPLSLPQPILESRAAGGGGQAARQPGLCGGCCTGVSQAGIWKILPPSEVVSGVHVWKRSVLESVRSPGQWPEYRGSCPDHSCLLAARQAGSAYLLRPPRATEWAG